MGLESMLLGAHAEGVRNVLAITGDPPEVGDYPGSRGVYEVDAIGLTQLVTRLNRGEDYNGRPIDAPTSFFVGVAVNPTADDLELEVERFHAEGRGGRALRDDADPLRPRATSTASASGSAAPGRSRCWSASSRVTSYRLALRLHNEVPGIVVPQPLQDALAEAGADAAEIGMAHARELIAATRGAAEGVYVVAPFRRPLAVLELFEWTWRNDAEPSGRAARPDAASSVAPV